MPQTSQRKRIPFENGIVTFGTGYEVGLRLLNCSRYVNKYVPLDPAVGVDFFDQSWAPQEVDESSAVILADCDAVYSAERFENGETSGGNTGYLFGGRRASTGNSSIWDQTGTRVHSVGTPTAFSSIVHWRSLATPTTFCTGPSMYSTTDRVTFSGYAPTGLPGVGKALLVYQNRLWISIGNKVYFTDVLDPTNVRLFGQVNPLVVPMSITCMDRVGVSDIDPGAQSHLLLAGTSQIWILDGAPGAGNQILRRYTNQVGIQKEEHIVSTNLGVVFYGTDKMLYLVPPGAVDEPMPIGGSIRNLFNQAGEVTILWRRPYLQVFLGNLKKTLYLDIATGEPKWWGSVGPAGSYSPAAVSNRWPSHNYIWTAGIHIGTSQASIFKIKEIGVSAEAQEMQTGFLFEPGHEVVLRKMHFTFRLSSYAKTYTVRSINSDFTVFEKTFQIPSGTKYQNFQIPMVVSGSPPSAKGLRGDFLYFTLSCPGYAGSGDRALAGLQHWEVEYDVIKRGKI